ncbi:MAG: substrate-binding domain-containing protein, partial [Candidatus Gallimonas sp.]
AESLGVRLSPAIEVDSWGFMKQLVVDGMGIGCIPREYAKNKTAQGLLFELDVQPALPSRSVGMALPKNANMSYALRAFVNLFKKK